MDYDSWKLATPWDDEVAMTVSFECRDCEHYNEDIETVGSRRSDEVYEQCEECGVENTVDVGRDE
jgi:hypothetical protein